MIIAYQPSLKSHYMVSINTSHTDKLKSEWQINHKLVTVWHIDLKDYNILLVDVIQTFTLPPPAQKIREKLSQLNLHEIYRLP